MVRFSPLNLPVEIRTLGDKAHHGNRRGGNGRQIAETVENRHLLARQRETGRATDIFTQRDDGGAAAASPADGLPIEPTTRSGMLAALRANPGESNQAIAALTRTTQATNGGQRPRAEVHPGLKPTSGIRPAAGILCFFVVSAINQVQSKVPTPGTVTAKQYRKFGAKHRLVVVEDKTTRHYLR
jgi:hypothetical protein